MYHIDLAHIDGNRYQWLVTAEQYFILYSLSWESRMRDGKPCMECCKGQWIATYKE